MKTPPFLIGATLLFWGWQADFLIAGAVMAVILESARFVKTRWEVSNEDFGRIWAFCALLFLATGAYAFTASDGPANFGSLLNGGGISARHNIGTTSTKTAVSVIRWMPMAFFLFIAAQEWSNREGIPLETISLILRRRLRRAKELGQPPPPSRIVNVSYPYVIACLFAASSHPSTDRDFYWALCGLLAWALWSFRSRRFGTAMWGITLGAAVLMGYGGQVGLVHLKRAMDNYNPQWLGGWAEGGFDAMESRTEIGQIGRIKTSSQIAIRLKTQNAAAPPLYLREAGYRIYRSPVWYAGMSKEEFASVPEFPLNSASWPLLPGKTNTASLNIACYLRGGNGLLPLPTGTGLMEKLQVISVEKNVVGTVHAEGPGLVVFDALYGNGKVIDAPPDDAEDVNVPEREKPALDAIISDLHLESLDRTKLLETISHYFGTQFSYSLWQERPRIKDTNTTDLGRFLKSTRSGHCEYFATATVLLLRELHIPARYTVGYAVHEASGSGYVVRQNDAHAWCRVWNDARKTWEDFDTTPGTWMAEEREQRSSLQFIADAWSRVVFEISKFRWGQSNLRQYILWALVPVLGLLLYQIIFRGDRRRASGNSKSKTARIVWPGMDSEFYRLEGELIRRGLSRNSGEPLSIWLRRAAADPVCANLREPLGRILSLHYRYRFDPAGLSADERDLLRKDSVDCLSQLEAQK